MNDEKEPSYIYLSGPVCSSSGFLRLWKKRKRKHLIHAGDSCRGGYTDADACTDAHSNSGTHTNSDAHTSSDAHTNSDTYTNSDTHTNPDSGAGAGSYSIQPAACHQEPDR